MIASLSSNCLAQVVRSDNLGFSFRQPFTSFLIATPTATAAGFDILPDTEPLTALKAADHPS